VSDNVCNTHRRILANKKHTVKIVLDSTGLSRTVIDQVTYNYIVVNIILNIPIPKILWAKAELVSGYMRLR